MSFFDDLFGGSTSDAYNKYAQSIQNMSHLFSPYTQAGEAELSPLSSEFGKLESDPQSFLATWMKGYRESPYATYQTSQIQNQLGRQAAAAGELGTPQVGKALASDIQGITSRDQQDYLNRVANLFGRGLSGQQTLAGYGLEGLGDMANLEAQGAQAQLQGALQSQKDEMGGIGSLLGLGGDILGSIF